MTTSQRVWLGLFILVVFVGGVSAGVVIDRVWLVRPRPPLAARLRPVEGRPLQLRALVPLWVLDRELRLSTDQLNEIAGIIAGPDGDVATPGAGASTAVRSREDLIREIEGVLNPDQVTRLRSLLVGGRRLGLLEQVPGGRRGGRAGAPGPGRRGRATDPDALGGTRP